MTRRILIILGLIIFIILATWNTRALVSHAGEVGRLEATIQRQKRYIKKLKAAQKSELGMRDTQLEVLNNKDIDNDRKIELIKAGMADLNRKIDEREEVK